MKIVISVLIKHIQILYLLIVSDVSTGSTNIRHFNLDKTSSWHNEACVCRDIAKHFHNFTRGHGPVMLMAVAHPFCTYCVIFVTWCNGRDRILGFKEIEVPWGISLQSMAGDRHGFRQKILKVAEIWRQPTVGLLSPRIQVSELFAEAVHVLASSAVRYSTVEDHLQVSDCYIFS